MAAVLRARPAAPSNSSASKLRIGLPIKAPIALGSATPCAGPKPHACTKSPTPTSNTPSEARPICPAISSTFIKWAGRFTHSPKGAAFRRFRSLPARQLLICCSTTSTAWAQTTVRAAACTSSQSSRTVQRLPIAGPERVRRVNRHPQDSGLRPATLRLSGQAGQGLLQIPPPPHAPWRLIHRPAPARRV